MSRGGRREGAGNKPKVPGNPNKQLLSTRISEATAAELDTLRGVRKRSDVVREAVEQWIERNKEK